MFNCLPKQIEIGKVTFQSVQFATTTTWKNRHQKKAQDTCALHILQLEILRFSDLFLPSLLVDCAQVVQLPSWPTEKQSKASVIKHPPFAEPTHALFRGRARTQAPTTRNYTLELPTFGVIARVNPIQVQ